jgi:hypothetical protein
MTTQDVAGDRAKHGEARELEGQFTYPDSPPSRAQVASVHRAHHARVIRAGQTLAAVWGLAIAAVFLPLLHWILVPALLVLGPTLAWSRLHEADTLIRADGPCPACGAAQHFKLGQKWRERTVLRCEACGRRIELALPSKPPEA